MQNTPVWQIYEMAEMEYVRNGVCLHNLKVPIPVGRFPIARPVIAHLSDGRERDMRFHDMRWNSPVPPAIWISMCDRASFFYCGNPFSPRRARHLRSPSQLAIWPPPGSLVSALAAFSLINGEKYGLPCARHCSFYGMSMIRSAPQASFSASPISSSLSTVHFPHALYSCGRFSSHSRNGPHTIFHNSSSGWWEFMS